MEKLLLAPWVIAMRWPGLMLSLVQPTPARKRENKRMVTEKVAATGDGMLAASMVAGRLALESWAALWSAGWPPLRAAEAWAEMANAALTPAARTVGANARRLSRRTRI